jgi:hypothetical protein
MLVQICQWDSASDAWKNVETMTAYALATLTDIFHYQQLLAQSQDNAKAGARKDDHGTQVDNP